MQSKIAPPKQIKLATTLKEQVLSMEVIFSRFSHLTEQIFNNLDNFCLTNCAQVTGPW